MQFSTIAIISAFAAAVSAHKHHHGNHSTSTVPPPVVWVTDIVTHFVTYCPAATVFNHNGVNYTATKNETVTITNCPCTISRPVYLTSSVVCSTCIAPSTSAPVSSAPSGSVPVYGNSSVPAPPTSTNPGGSVGTPSVPVGSNASSTVPGSFPSSSHAVSSNGNRVIAISGISLAGLLGVAAYIL